MWSEALLSAAFVFVIILCCLGLYLWWLQKPPAERAEIREDTQRIMEEARRLVENAEQKFPEAKSGLAKFGWVVNVLSQQFPDVEYDRLGRFIEQAVYRMNQSKAARHGAHVNGKNGV